MIDHSVSDILSIFRPYGPLEPKKNQASQSTKKYEHLCIVFPAFCTYKIHCVITTHRVLPVDLYLSNLARSDLQYKLRKKSEKWKKKYKFIFVVHLYKMSSCTRKLIFVNFWNLFFPLTYEYSPEIGTKPSVDKSYSHLAGFISVAG